MSTPEFDPKKVVIVFVLGGPGAGKGTHCESLKRDYDFVHLSAGDLLRAEQQREGSQYGKLIADCIKEGKIVPMEVTIGLLRNAIKNALDTRANDNSEAWGDGRGRFLIDGFPRKLDQSEKFEATVVPSQLVLFLSCTEEVMLQRLLQRGETSGRADDNVESIRKRFRTFVDTSMPVVDHFRKNGLVVEINAMNSIDKVYADICKSMDERFHAIHHS